MWFLCFPTDGTRRQGDLGGGEVRQGYETKGAIEACMRDCGSATIAKCLCERKGVGGDVEPSGWPCAVIHRSYGKPWEVKHFGCCGRASNSLYYHVYTPLIDFGSDPTL